MADNSLKDQITAMIEKAERSLDAADNLLRDGDYDFSSSRSYYGAFYSLQALLLTREMDFQNMQVLLQDLIHISLKQVFLINHMQNISAGCSVKDILVTMVSAH